MGYRCVILVYGSLVVLGHWSLVVTSITEWPALDWLTCVMVRIDVRLNSRVLIPVMLPRHFSELSLGFREKCDSVCVMFFTAAAGFGILLYLRKVTTHPSYH